MVRTGERALVVVVAVVAIGLDVVEMPRARELFTRHRDRIVARLLTAEEQEYVRSLGDPVPAFAARLAAKEAVYKALQIFPGTRGVGWREIGVHRLPDGRPEAVLEGVAANLIAERRCRVHLSLSHSRDVAAAVAVIETVD